jgi:hypothetical protein
VAASQVCAELLILKEKSLTLHSFRDFFMVQTKRISKRNDRPQTQNMAETLFIGDESL